MTNSLVDTNILIYSIDSRDDKHETSVLAIQKLVEAGDLVISSQNLAELSRVLLEKVDPPQKHEDVMKYLFKFKTLGRVIHYKSDTVVDAVNVSKQYKIHFFDALLVATMQENNISDIITENTKDFRKIKWLDVKNPFE